MSGQRTPALRRGDPRSLPQMIVDHLATHGQTMAREIASELGVSHELVRVKLAHLKKQQRVRIGGWIRARCGQEGLVPTRRACRRWATANTTSATAAACARP